MIKSALQLRDKNKYHNGFTIMWENTELLLVEWFPYKKRLPYFKTTPISCEKHWAIPDELFTKPTRAIFERFLESRCFDRTCEDAQQLLKWYGLPEYLPLSICKKSYGIKSEDFLWIRFDGMEHLRYDDIRLK